MLAGSMVWMAASAPAGLGGQGGAGGGPFVVTQDPAGDRLPLQALHHQPARPELIALADGDHGGHRHAGRRRSAQQGPLHPHAAQWRADAAVHLQNERARGAVRGVELERAGDARGATGQAPQPAHRAAEPAPERGRHLVTAESWRHPYSTGTTGLPPSSSWCRYSAMP